MENDFKIYNSWWESGGLWQDPDLARLKISNLNYRPNKISPAEIKSGAPILTIRGPRRSGKTVLAKRLIAELIEAEGWLPRKILWMSFDTVRTLAQAETILVDVCERYDPFLLIIDEVTAVVGWQRVIKKLRDVGILSKVAMVLTGSSSHDLRAGSERMAGRRGTLENPDRVLLPMSFSEFREQLIYAKVYKDDTETTNAYLSVGGFPFRVDTYIESLKNKSQWKSDIGISVFDDVFFYEISKRRMERTIALEILGRLSEIQPGAISYEGFAKPLSIAKDTLRRYLNILGDAFLLATISSFDTSRGRVAPKKDKKFVWLDPSLALLAPHVGQGKEVDIATRAEWAVGVELIRVFERRLFEGVSSVRNVFTWKSSGGNEIDYLVIDRSIASQPLPVEVKYQSTISDWDFQVMERAFGSGVTVTRQTSRKREKSRAMPFSEFGEWIREGGIKKI